MTVKNVEYPAKLVGYRIDAVHDRIVLFEDIPVLFNDAELERRRATYAALEAAGAIPYTFELVGLEDLDARMADIKADLERQLDELKEWWQKRKKREPEPIPDLWGDAVLDATQMAQGYFVDQGDRAALKRLPSAQSIADRQNWHRIGDKFDTWLMPSESKSGRVYLVNGQCTCPDPTRWCKHRLARGIAKRAAELLRNGNGAGSAHDTSAPDSMKAAMQTEAESTTPSENGQAERIELIVGYEASEGRTMARINANGQLITFEADGQPTEPPTQSISELYRWLQGHGYVPASFKWLGWEHGLRHRRQMYVLAKDTDTALPVQHSRGRSKLFKEAGR